MVKVYERNCKAYGVYLYDEYLDALRRIKQIQADIRRVERFHEDEYLRKQKHSDDYSYWSAAEAEREDSRSTRAPYWQEKQSPDGPDYADARFADAYSPRESKPTVQGYLAYLDYVAAPLAQFVVGRELGLLLSEERDRAKRIHHRLSWLRDKRAVKASGAHVHRQRSVWVSSRTRPKQQDG